MSLEQQVNEGNPEEGNRGEGEGVSPENNAGEGSPSVSGDFASLVPAEYKDKPYMKDIGDLPSLFKRFDNAQALIGKKHFSIPDETEGKEVWDAFYNKMGRPSNPEEYKIENSYTDLLGEEKGLSFDKRIKEIFYENGLTKRQVDKVLQEYNAVSQEAQQVYMDKLKGQHAAVQDKFVSFLGDDAEVIDDRMESVMGALLDEDIKKTIVDNLDEKSKVLLGVVLNQVHKKFIKDDNLPDRNQLVSPNTIETINQEIMTLRKDPAYYDAVHPQHTTLRNKIYDLIRKRTKLEKS